MATPITSIAQKAHVDSPSGDNRSGGINDGRPSASGSTNPGLEVNTGKVRKLSPESTQTTSRVLSTHRCSFVNCTDDTLSATVDDLGQK